ncbi:MAG TPA: TlpA disulfide reductase family protein [Chitinophagales bacterium]|nr:TlpA disulfide reductase family protein [Chitinophagales bacterium]
MSEISLEQLQQAHVKDNDTLYVVNFWATWCKPCVAEMPFFGKAAETFGNQKVKIVFVSLNYPREIAAVDKFVKQKNIRPTCYVLNAGSPNVWIDKIEKEWSGSIPATIMYKGGKKVYFREGDFTQTELDSIIKTNLQ